MKLQYLIISIFIVLCLASYTNALGKSKFAPYPIAGIYLTDAEYLGLPDFLQVKVRYHGGKHPPEYLAWNSRLGMDYQHYHHWASAIVKFNRAINIKEHIKRNFSLKQVLGAYDYLLKNCSPDNQFRYLFHLRKGEIYYILSKYALAAKELQMSLNYKDDYELTYSVLSRVYSQLGMESQADAALKIARKLRGE